MKSSPAILSQNSFVWLAPQEETPSQLLSSSRGPPAELCGSGSVVGLSSDIDLTQPSVTKASLAGFVNNSNRQWSCQICTLFNEPVHLSCSACAAPCGEKINIIRFVALIHLNQDFSTK